MGYYMLVAYMAGSPFFPLPPRVRPPLQAPQGFFNRTRTITLKPEQACAIPLLNVLPRGPGYDRGMVKHLPPTPVPSAEIVSPPAPSCDDVK
jgi:hypothetical protein